jgi:hypothetical protein
MPVAGLEAGVHGSDTFRLRASCPVHDCVGCPSRCRPNRAFGARFARTLARNRVTCRALRPARGPTGGHHGPTARCLRTQPKSTIGLPPRFAAHESSAGLTELRRPAPFDLDRHRGEQFDSGEAVRTARLRAPRRIRAPRQWAADMAHASAPSITLTQPIGGLGQLYGLRWLALIRLMISLGRTSVTSCAWRM